MLKRGIHNEYSNADTVRKAIERRDDAGGFAVMDYQQYRFFQAQSRSIYVFTRGA